MRSRRTLQRIEDGIGRIRRIGPIGRITTLLLGIFLLAASGRAAVSDWRYLPIWGGDVRTVVFDPANADTVFAGTAGGQIYISHNGGRTWANAGSHLPFPGWVVSNLQFDPNRP
ncbi:MAG TPA: hypothetical protein VFR03_04120, partial [Thermoanaerobaculia bacterium]|nr:hypothetical protein [Thermoanaerobaculia bacterium]